MKPLIRALSVAAALGLMLLAFSVPALAGTRPVVTGLSAHHGTYWGGSVITVHGRNFTSVRKVLFGTKRAPAVRVVSSTTIIVRDPEHRYGPVNVRVVTAMGTSSASAVTRFTFTRPTMHTRIMGGLTARQEQTISAHVRANHHGVHTAHRSRRWTAAMGVTAMKRARSWLGLPYSWAGGSSRGPTLGVCAHNGGDLDCHVVGFDCSGLTLYAWAPYKQLVHYAATQHSRAGRFHPSIGELMPGDLVFFSGYIAKGIGHVAIYEGHGNVIQAEQSGTRIMRSRLVDVIAAGGKYRGATRPVSTGRQGPGPRVSAVASQLAIKGGYVTITGRNLAGATSVSIGGTRIYSFARRTSSHLTVKAPAHRAGRVTITVYNAWGSASRALTYVGAPQISALAPSGGPTAGGTVVTITGKYLDPVSKVTVDATPVRFRVGSATRLTVTMPPHAPGPATLIVYSRFGASNRSLFSYVPPPTSPAPTLTTSSPPSTSPPSTSTAPNSTSAPSTSPPDTSSPPGSPAPASSPSTTAAPVG